MKVCTFKNNDKMPAFGLGTWKSKPNEVHNAIKLAIKQGYRHIDCAPIYGNESEIGKALAECLAEEIVTRVDMWITSKLWNDAHDKSDVIPALKQTLCDLQIDYLDLFLMHWPIALKKGTLLAKSAEDLVALDEMPLAQTWEAMEEAHNLGLAKHIGVSNFGQKHLGNLLEKARIKPEMNQIELHPYLQQEQLFSYCNAHEVLITAYSPLGAPDRPDMIKRKDESQLLHDSTIKAIATAKNATPAQVLVSWALHKDVAVIPKSVNPSRIVENFQAQQLRLSKEEIATIATLDKNFRYVSGQFWVFEGSPYTLQNIWA